MSDRICKVEGCTGKHQAKGYCDKHYGRLRRNGSLETVRRPSNMTDDEIVEFILNNIKIYEESECWIWQKRITEQGYGEVAYKGTHTVVHRLLYKILINPSLPDNVYLDHENCISRACGNPHHVRPVDKSQNNSHRVVLQPSNVTGYRNVSFRKNRKKPYRVVIQKDGKQLYFGSYSTVEEANEIAIQKRTELFGEYAGTV